jgi:RNA polymerase sigma factor (sigma-70 family)
MTPILSSTILRTQTDARLLALASRGYERAFEAIVERYRKPLYRWCRTILPDARAEDAVQTAFLKAWSALESGTEVGDLKPWLYRIARNAALDNARKAGYDYEELSEALRLAPAPESELERRSVMRETLTGVAGLPDNQREALLRTASGHSRADIARDLHVTEGAVRQLVHRARSTLRAAATAVVPMPLVNWAAALGAEASTPASQRIAELAAGASGAGLAATAVKAGTVVVAAGVLAAGPGAHLRDQVSAQDVPPAATQRAGADGPGDAGDDRGGRDGSGDDSSAERRGRGRNDSGSDDRRGSDDSSGSGRSGGDDSSGSGSSGSGDDSSGSGSSGSGSSESGTSGSGTSGSGSSGSSGSGISGSGTSGSDSSGLDSSGSDSSGSGTSGSGTSGSGTSGSGTSLSGTSGSGSSGSGSGGALRLPDAD